MVSPTEDKQPEESSASDNDLDNVKDTEDTSASNPPEEEISTFDAIMSAIKPEDDSKGDDDKSGEDESESSKDDASKDEKTNDEDDESGDPSEDELKAWKPKTRKRFENLQAKYRDVSERLVKAESDAGQYRQFVDFLDSNGLDQDEANRLFNIGALMKNDPFAALQAITPYYHQLLEITGQILPPDLMEQVNAGYLTRAHALEVSRARAMGRITPTIAQRQQQRQQQKDSRQQGQIVVSMQNAVSAWEQKWSSSDPDYASKKDRVLDRLELMLARAARDKKLPNTVEQAVALAEKARRDVEADFRKSRPKKPVSVVDGGNSGNSHLPEPKDTRDVIRRALNK